MPVLWHCGDNPGVPDHEPKAIPAKGHIHKGTKRRKVQGSSHPPILAATLRLKLSTLSWLSPDQQHLPGWWHCSVPCSLGCSQGLPGLCHPAQLPGHPSGMSHRDWQCPTAPGMLYPSDFPGLGVSPWPPPLLLPPPAVLCWLGGGGRQNPACAEIPAGFAHLGEVMGPEAG